MLALDGDLLARLSATGTHDGAFLRLAPTGKRVTIAAAEAWRLRDGQCAEHWLQMDVLDLLEQLGPVAVVGELDFVGLLPKTRSGEIMRRVLKAVTPNRDPGDISTIEDEGSVEDAREAWRQMQAAVGPEPSLVS